MEYAEYAHVLCSCYMQGVTAVAFLLNTWVNVAKINTCDQKPWFSRGFLISF